jgi:hypothetical protein
MKRVPALTVAMAIAICGCTNVSDCPESGVLGSDVNRLRTASYRSRLDNSPVAAKRFVHLAAMSGLAYWHEGKDCKFEDQHLNEGDAKQLKQVLTDVSAGTRWNSLDPELAKLNLPTECQDEIGLFFRVWQRPHAMGSDDVVIAFRGTSNRPDWMYGNLWWITRFFAQDNQYSRSTRLLEVVLKNLHEHAQAAGKPDPRIVVTGHSLGGGLAQHALYNFPSIKQAVVFDPSPATAYVDSRHGKEVLACECDSELKTEAKIIRVYESDEILSRVRFWHKLFFPSDLQIQEVRFAFNNGPSSVKAHSMRDLTFSLQKESNQAIKPELVGKSWYATLAAGCTEQIEHAQATACAARENICKVR